MTSSLKKFLDLRQCRCREQREKDLEFHDTGEVKTKKKTHEATVLALFWVGVGLVLSVGGLLGLQVRPLEWSVHSSLTVFIYGPLAIVCLASCIGIVRCFVPDLKLSIQDGMALYTAFFYEAVLLVCAVMSGLFFYLASLAEIMATAVLFGVIALVVGLNKYLIARIENPCKTKASEHD